MPRTNRVDVGGYCYHVINRANARLPIFFQEEDYKLLKTFLKKRRKNMACVFSHIV